MDISFDIGVQLQKKIYDKDKIKYIDLSSGLIINDENKKILSKLGKRDIKVLGMLVANNKKLTTRDELMNYVWCGRVVTDNVLNVSISNIRRILVDFDPSAVELIRTINGLGYYFDLDLSNMILDD